MEIENSSYSVLESDGSVEVCAVLNSPARANIIVLGSARELPTPDAQGE